MEMRHEPRTWLSTIIWTYVQNSNRTGAGKVVGLRQSQTWRKFLLEELTETIERGEAKAMPFRITLGYCPESDTWNHPIQNDENRDELMMATLILGQVEPLLGKLRVTHTTVDRWIVPRGITLKEVIGLLRDMIPLEIERVKNWIRHLFTRVAGRPSTPATNR